MFGREDNGEEESLRVIMIGNDDVMRIGECNKSDKFYDGKYQVDPDAVFYMKEKSFMRKESIPTIAFYENDYRPIKRREAQAKFSPDEIGDAIYMGAWALAKLFFQHDEKFEKTTTILLIVAIVVGAASAGVGIMNYQKLDKMDQKLDAIAYAYANTPSSPGAPGVIPTPTSSASGNLPVPTPVAVPGQTLPPGVVAG